MLLSTTIQMPASTVVPGKVISSNRSKGESGERSNSTLSLHVVSTSLILHNNGKRTIGDRQTLGQLEFVQRLLHPLVDSQSTKQEDANDTQLSRQFHLQTPQNWNRQNPDKKVGNEICPRCDVQQNQDVRTRPTR